MRQWFLHSMPFPFQSVLHQEAKCPFLIDYAHKLYPPATFMRPRMESVQALLSGEPSQFISVRTG